MGTVTQWMKQGRTHWILIGGWVVLFALLFGFLKLGSEIWEQEGFSWDAPIIQFIRQFATPWLTTVFIAITQLGNLGAFVVVGIMSLLWWRHDRRAVAALIISALGSVLLNGLLKAAFSRPRPTLFPPLVNEQNFSFPSGHAMLAVAVYGFLSYYWFKEGSRGKAALMVVVIVLIGLSRVYLGVHYPSDIVGATAVGTAWLIIVLTWYERHIPRLPHLV